MSLPDTKSDKCKSVEDPAETEGTEIIPHEQDVIIGTDEIILVDTKEMMQTEENSDSH